MGVVADEASSHRYGTFWQRAGSAAVDGLVLYPLTVGLRAMHPGRAEAFLSILVPALFWLYEVGTLGRWGQTVGKMVMGVQVRRTDFRPVGYRVALLRCAVTILIGCAFIGSEVRLAGSVPPEILQAIPFECLSVFAAHFLPGQSFLTFFWASSVWGAAELVTMLFHPRRRAVHDLIAGTVVIQTPSAVGRTRGQRIRWAVATIVGWAVIMALSSHSTNQPRRSWFPDGTLQGEYQPWQPRVGTENHYLLEQRQDSARPDRTGPDGYEAERDGEDLAVV